MAFTPPITMMPAPTASRTAVSDLFIPKDFSKTAAMVLACTIW